MNYELLTLPTISPIFRVEKIMIFPLLGCFTLCLNSFKDTVYLSMHAFGRNWILIIKPKAAVFETHDALYISQWKNISQPVVCPLFALDCAFLFSNPVPIVRTSLIQAQLYKHQTCFRSFSNFLDAL